MLSNMSPFRFVTKFLKALFGVYIYIYIYVFRVSQEECEILRECVPYVKLYRYNPKHLYPKLNGYGDNGQRKVWTSCISAFYTPTAVSRATPPSRSSDCLQSVRWLVLRRASSTQRDKTVLHCCYICKCLEHLDKLVREFL